MPDFSTSTAMPERRIADANPGHAGHMPWPWHGGAIIFFSLLTAGLFAHRWVGVDWSSVYSMPDVDTDGTLWFLWLKVHSGEIFSSMALTGALTHPFGYDLS